MLELHTHLKPSQSHILLMCIFFQVDLLTDFQDQMGPCLHTVCFFLNLSLMCWFSSFYPNSLWQIMAVLPQRSDGFNFNKDYEYKSRRLLRKDSLNRKPRQRDNVTRHKGAFMTKQTTDSVICRSLQHHSVEFNTTNCQKTQHHFKSLRPLSTNNRLTRHLVVVPGPQENRGRVAKQLIRAA